MALAEERENGEPESHTPTSLDPSPKTGSLETSYLELDQTAPDQSVTLFHLESTNHPLLQENNENGDLKC